MVKIGKYNWDEAKLCKSKLLGYYYFILSNFDECGVTKMMCTLGYNKPSFTSYAFTFDEFDNRKVIKTVVSNDMLNDIVKTLPESKDKDDLLELLSY